MTLTHGWSHPDAECLGMDPAIFLPDRGNPVDHRAVKACARGPVRAECRQWAVDHKEVGYWGGTSERDRRKLPRNTPPPATTLILEYLHRHPGMEFHAEDIARAIGKGDSTVREALRRLRAKGEVRSRNTYRRGGGSGGVSMQWHVPRDVEVRV